MSTRRVYEIGERKFYQDKLVLGQIEHLLKLLRSVGEFAMDVQGVLEMVTKRYDVLAVVLVPEGMTRGQLVEQLDNGGGKEAEKFLRDELDWVTLAQVVSDFFDCNPVSVLSNAMAGLQRKVSSDLFMPSRSSSKVSTSPSPEDSSQLAPTPGAV